MGEFYHPLPKTNILLRHENLHVTVGFAQPHGHMYFTFKPHHPILNGRIVGKQEVIRLSVTRELVHVDSLPLPPRSVQPSRGWQNAR